jgi:hypothetical protein
VSKCPVHRLFRYLREFAGLPVPYIVKWKNDKPDFRDTDFAKWVEVVQGRLCSVCGRKLDEPYCYYLSGHKSAGAQLFTDPPAHHQCALDSMQLCPFLNGTRKEYRGHDLTPHPLQTSNVDRRRPAQMVLAQGKTRNIQMVSVKGGVLVHSGPLKIIRAF